MSAVRLWRRRVPNQWSGESPDEPVEVWDYLFSDPEEMAGPFKDLEAMIALPSADHAEVVALLGEARGYVESASTASNDPDENHYAAEPEARASAAALLARLTAALQRLGVA